MDLLNCLFLPVSEPDPRAQEELSLSGALAKQVARRRKAQASSRIRIILTPIEEWALGVLRNMPGMLGEGAF